jgi:hypothetical protein
MWSLAAALVAATVVMGAQTSAPSLELPDSAGAWVVEISITGGFTGRGMGGLAVASTGRTVCAAPSACAELTPPDTLTRVGRVIAALRTAPWGEAPSRRTCFDCFLTTMTIRTRAGDGRPLVSVFSWTDADTGNVPADVRDAYRSVMSLGERGR